MTYVSNTLQLLLLISIPQTLTSLWFSFVCLEFFPERYAKRMIIYSILQSTYVASLFFLLPTWAHIINSIASTFLFFSFIFPETKIKLRILVIFFMMVVASAFDLTYVYLSSFLGGYENVLHNTILFKLTVFWPGFLCTALVTGFMQWKHIHIARQIRDLAVHIRSRPYIMLFSLVFLQVFLFFIFFSHTFIKPLQINTLQIMFILSIALFIFMTVKIMQIIAQARLDGIYQSQEACINDLNKMFASIRGQRHDFANHVQVMYSMLILKKYDQLRAYMEKVVNEIQSMNVAIVDLPSPALAALVQAKAAIALEKRIRFDYLIHTTSLTFSSVTSIDLVRMIGNLVDNAFDEVVKLPSAEREVQLEMYIHNQELYITVTNRGKHLTSEEIEQIFQPGFTTKADGHCGLGLANVRERAASYNGQVTVDSDLARGITFTIQIPNSKQVKTKQA
ncbi:GHKL domain-containing protein [Paenibacillus oenotherae]|uniref:histidine kinase n=1 Tax=Paenibacillus oenotherae TaxID=1435645 RepID=A0ABS7DAS0_9BACL|nr:ATP-binding protein [Paenibacillus oenotherae]MBW7477037.1 GHKL domain-containing protein [Paenibacillus oenotherae]